MSISISEDLLFFLFGHSSVNGNCLYGRSLGVVFVHLTVHVPNKNDKLLLLRRRRQRGSSEIFDSSATSPKDILNVHRLVGKYVRRYYTIIVLELFLLVNYMVFNNMLSRI